MTGRSVRRLLAVFLLSVFWLVVTFPKLSGAQVASTQQPPVRANASSLSSAAPAATARSPLIDELSERDPRSQDNLAFQHLVRSAGIIFSGRVTSVGSDASAIGQLPHGPAITFQVEHALRGTSPGQSLTIHEWAGLWQNGERYHVGEHVLLFLYAPSKLGLTSPVAGSIGKFGISAEGKVQISPLQRQFFATDPLLGGKTVLPYIDFAGALRSFSKREAKPKE